MRNLILVVAMCIIVASCGKDTESVVYTKDNAYHTMKCRYNGWSRRCDGNTMSCTGSDHHMVCRRRYE